MIAQLAPKVNILIGFVRALGLVGLGPLQVFRGKVLKADLALFHDPQVFTPGGFELQVLFDQFSRLLVGANLPADTLAFYVGIQQFPV